MNDFLLAALLGVVEGITEFLPVSSTAHLRIVQHFVGISLEDEYWKLFAVFIQLGAILSLFFLYGPRLKKFLSQPLRGRFLNHPVSLIGMAFLCTAIPAFLLKKVIGNNLENLHVMVAALFVGGLVMFVVDRFFASGKITTMDEAKPTHAVFIGLTQVLSAVFPGTSRSMSTIAAGQLVGLSRPAALDFSFLVSIPIMIVATLYDLYKYAKEMKAAGVSIALSGHQLAVLAVGFCVSFVVAYFVVAWFLRYVRERGFTPFAVYRIALAIFLLFFL